MSKRYSNHIFKTRQNLSRNYVIVKTQRTEVVEETVKNQSTSSGTQLAGGEWGGLPWPFLKIKK